MGYTSGLQYKITLRPDAVSRHQRPYHLSPDKLKVLRHQLDELLHQGVIALIGYNEDASITSLIVLITKRNNPKVDPAPITREQSVSSYRFCINFRYLNSQAQDLRYTNPDLQELTESFYSAHPSACRLSI